MKKNMIILLIVFFIVLIIIIDSLMFFNPKNQLPNVILRDNLSVERNTKVRISYFIKEIENGEMTSSNDYIDTSQTGEQKIIIVVTNKYGKKRDYIFYINVI